ncbi:MAG: nucleotidyltransferase family protein [Thermodesulfobacteriota bacterium]
MTVRQPHWFRQLYVRPEQTIRDGLKVLNEKGHQFLFVVDDHERLTGVVSDGDFRRAIFNGESFDAPLGKIMTRSPMQVAPPVDNARVLALMKTKNIRYLPVVDAGGHIVDVRTWQDFLVTEAPKRPLRTEPVVIMAGGKGTRLDPFTRILPKPLIPFGDRPMIEWIMDNFAGFGFRNFWVTLNYKRQTIRNYFAGLTKPYAVGFVEEDSFLGTAGALTLMKDELTETFLVSNCDVVLEDNFAEIVDFHRANKNLLTVVAVPRHVRIPYGVLDIHQEALVGIREKPEFTYLVAGGVYVVEPEAIRDLPRGEHIEMPGLMERLLAVSPGRVGVYPTSGKWFDIGQWEEYQQALLKLSMGGLGVFAEDEEEGAA